jgi:predicted TIM-barrel fold metal-dependent hydrolase
MFEWHTSSYPATYAAHLASLVCSGTLARIPDLRFVMVEGGISWSLPLGYHLDKNWRLLRSEVPELSELPSTYLRRQVLFTTQPVEESYSSRNDILQAWQELGAETRVMFSSDYPHWDYDEPSAALPPMPKDLRARIMGQTARELYKLPPDRPVAG